MKPRPKAIYHHGTCRQFNGESGVLTIAGTPFDLSLCGACLALLVGGATGIRAAIRARWALHNKQTAAQRGRRWAELERKAREDLERLLKLDGGNGKGI
jgi:hypothetical protein